MHDFRAILAVTLLPVALGHGAAVAQQACEFPGVTHGVGDGPQVVIMADLDGDLDTNVVANWGSDSVTVLMNDGAGGWDGTTYGVGQEPLHVLIADLEPDYYPDIVTINGEFDDVTVLLSSCRCIGDINGNGIRNFSDLLLLLAAWGPCDHCSADIDGDGDVGFSDLLLLLAYWGTCVSNAPGRETFAGRAPNRPVESSPSP